MRENAHHPLTRVLKAFGWTQSELARRADVAQPTISFALSGKRGGRFSPRTARKILAVVDAARAERAPGKRRQLPPLALEDLIFAPKNDTRAA